MLAGRTEGEEVKQQQQQSMASMTSGRLDAKSSWWVSDPRVADCKKTWLHEHIASTEHLASRKEEEGREEGTIRRTSEAV